MELATASQFKIGVKVLVLNNEFQGMVEQWQGQRCLPSTPLFLYILMSSLLHRPVLRKPLFTHGNDKPGLREAGAGDGRARHPVPLR
jgi:hypothetical protein